MFLEFIDPGYIVLLAGAAFTIGYLIVNQIWLRVSMLVGTSLYIWYYATVADTPLWEAVWTSTIMGCANIIGLTSLLARNSKHAIPRVHRDIYPLFKALPPGDFRRLIRLSTRRKVASAEIITQENVPANRLFYLISGSAKVTKKDEGFEMPAGVFVGEVPFVTGQNSVATTELHVGTEILEWSFDALKKRAAKSDRFGLALQAMIAEDLAHKVAAGVAPHDSEHLARNFKNQARRLEGLMQKD